VNEWDNRSMSRLVGKWEFVRDISSRSTVCPPRLAHLTSISNFSRLYMPPRTGRQMSFGKTKSKLTHSLLPPSAVLHPHRRFHHLLPQISSTLSRINHHLNLPLLKSYPSTRSSVSPASAHRPESKVLSPCFKLPSHRSDEQHNWRYQASQGR
jgi:hypothetical protein